MVAHGVPCGVRLGTPDRLEDARMLGQKAQEIGLPRPGRVGADADERPRDDEGAEKAKKLAYQRVAGGIGDGAVKGKILLEGRAARLDLLGHRPVRLGQECQLRRAGRAGGQGRGLDLDAEPELHDVNDGAVGAEGIGVDAERPAAGVGRDEGSRSRAG